MKKILSLFLCFVFILSFFAACSQNKGEDIKDNHVYGKIFYVSLSGNDNNEGSENSPLATISGAVEAMRKYRSENGLPEGGIKIEFAAGTYDFQQGITLSEEDSGTEESPVVFSGQDGATTIFNGGIILNSSDFEPADDEFKSLLPTEEAKNNVVMIDLAKAGCYDLDDSKQYTGWLASSMDPRTSMEFESYRQELFINGERKTVARWPNEMYFHPEIDSGITMGDDGIQYNKILISDEQAAVWRNVETIRFYGMPEYEWANMYLSDVEVDETSSALLISANKGITKDCMYYVFNIPYELDTPGEYYWNTETNILYYWPEEDLKSSEISFSQYSSVPITLSNCSYVSFENFTAKYFRCGLISGSGDHVNVSKCAVYDMGGSAMIYLDGDFNSVTGCLMHDLSAAAVILSTGDVATQTNGQSVISDNIIHDWAQFFTVYNEAASMNGFGGRISHNEFYNCPHYAIAIRTAQCDIEYNDIHDACREVADGGSIQTWGRFTYAGNVYRYNYFHQIGDIVNPALGIDRCGLGSAIFFDFWGRFSTCYCNVFVDVKGCCMCGASGHMTYQNNLCVNVGEPINISYWGIDEQPDVYERVWLTEDIRLYDYLNQTWRYSSPKTILFAEMHDQHITPNFKDNPLSASYDIVQNNVRFIDTTAEYKAFDCDNEEIYTKDGIIRTSDYMLALSPILDNVCYTDVDPGFTDYANGDYSLREDSRVYRDLIGFETFDVSTTGVRPNANPFK